MNKKEYKDAVQSEINTLVKAVEDIKVTITDIQRIIGKFELAVERVKEKNLLSKNNDTENP